MKKILLFTIVLLSAFEFKAGADNPTDSLNVGPFGKVFIYMKTPVPANVAIMISGDGGWRYGVKGFASSFSEMNTLVIGVDILRYYKELKHRNDECYDVAADFVQLATEVEKKYNYPDYKAPMVMGYSSGATLVYGILAQARPETFIGGISVGFCADIELPHMLCELNGLKENVLIEGKSYLFEPDARLGNPWIVLQGKLDKVCPYPAVEAFVAKTTDAELITLPDVGHGFSKWSDFMPQWKDAYNRIIEKSKKDQPVTDNVSNPKKLPVVITNALEQNREAPVALLISGDGGWYGFEQQIADNLAKHEIPTVGLDSKKYFWNRRTPDETARDIGNELNYYLKEWGRDKLVLVGYSLGAEIVPFIVNRLSEDVKSKVISVVLLSPDVTTDFEIHISNMLGMGNRQNTYDVAEEIKKIEGVNTILIFGEGEKSKVPELLKGASVKISFIPGDHHYKFNLPLIMQTMVNNKAF
jgi:type IV secretory pathway VirJ component